MQPVAFINIIISSHIDHPFICSSPSLSIHRHEWRTVLHIKKGTNAPNTTIPPGVIIIYYIILSIIFIFVIYRLIWILPYICLPLWPSWYAKLGASTFSIDRRGDLTPILDQNANIYIWPMALLGVHLLIHFPPIFTSRSGT